MKAVEPELDDELHEQVTHLLCELSAYNIMHTIHQLVEAAAQDEVPRVRQASPGGNASRERRAAADVTRPSKRELLRYFAHRPMNA